MKKTVILSKPEREVILKCLYIADAFGRSEGDYQTWKPKHWKVLKELIDKMYDDLE